MRTKQYKHFVIAATVVLFTACDGVTTEQIQSLADSLGVVLPDTTDPVFTSSATASVNENQTSAITLVATDESTVTYSISGTDAGDFSVDARSGVVTFNAAPVYETKTSYAFTATATDASSNTATQAVTINIVDVDEGIVHNGTSYGTVTSPYTGKVWLDRNLGAAQVCTSFDDTACYGDYYQWGRNFDGHEDSMSGITNAQATDINNAGGDFIISVPVNSYDWAKTADSDGSLREANWSKTDGSSVCPVGYRVPTIGELTAETVDNGVIDGDTAFTNFLKLPSAGARNYETGILSLQGSWGNVWASSVDGSDSQFFGFNRGGAEGLAVKRANGLSVRCLRD